MTTIAYKNGIIAYDSRTTIDGTIFTDQKEKRVFSGGVNFFLCGADADYDCFINAYLLNDWVVDVDLDVLAITSENSGAYYVVTSVDTDGKYRISRQKLNDRDIWAIGSGGRFARAFMTAGYSAKDAVEKTKLLDVYTGGEVKTFEVPRIN